LPRGLLRERPSALARAHAIVLTRVDQAPSASLVELRRELDEAAPGVALAAAVHAPSRWRALSGSLEPLEALRGREVDLVSGIGHPEAFERTVGELGARVVEHRRFPDHHAYAAGDLAGLGARPVAITAKDAVKLRRVAGGLAPAIRVLEVELELVEGETVLEALIDALPPARARAERAALHEGLHG
jgi:tetraacyldisaccharide 4'-kinase